MNLKTIGLIVATAIISIAISRILLSNEPGSSTAVVSEQRNSDAGKDISDPVVNVTSPSTKKPVKDEAERSSSADAMDSDYAENQNLKNQSGVNLEQYLTHNGTFDTTRLSELDSNEAFDTLVAQLREQTNPIGTEKRRSYELLFYSQALSRDGSVALDTLECGARLCVSELRADDKATLDQFIKSLTSSSQFEAKAVIQLRGYPNLAAGNSETRRLIFPHDSTIDGVTISRELLAGHN